MAEVPKLVTLDELVNLVPGTTKNFWYQRSRLGRIPGQHKCGHFIVIDQDVFIAALLDGKIDTLKRDAKGKLK